MDIEQLKARVCAEVDRRADSLVEASHQIHGRPELAYEEHFAHDLLTSLLEGDGLDVDRGAYGIETAFASRVGREGPVVAVLCEYDALPGIGHACGHNIIGTAGVGAGLAAAVLADELGGRLAILGTPAEEGGGGKIKMAEQGAFDGIDAAMMIHPAGADLPLMSTIAIQQLWVDYHGEAAHAAAFPYKGRNALDAAVLGYVNIAALRQHIRPNERVHGIFTQAGDKPNIVPDHAAAHWYVRSPNLRLLEDLKARVLACLEAGTAAAGCRMEHRWQEFAYSDMLDNQPMVDLYAANSAALGRPLQDPSLSAGVVGSTDMGNVSYLVPSIHPMVKVAPAHVSIHSPEFTRYAASSDGDRAVVDAAKAMAMTVVDLWTSADRLAAAGDAWRTATERAATATPG